MRSSKRLLTVLLLGLLVVAAFLVDDCEAAKKKKKRAKKTAPEPEDDDEDGQPKPKKAWEDMTKADWDRLEREADEPSEPYKLPEPPSIPFDPKNPHEFMAAQKKGKPAMMFASLHQFKDPETGKMRERTKEETEEVAFRHKSLMNSGHLDSTPYVIDPNKILWTTNDGSKGFDVKDFILRQPEVEEFEWDSEKTLATDWRKKMKIDL